MKIEKHEPGAFCWIELGTSDAAGAKAFYDGLFGWTATDMPVGPDMTYSMMRLGGGDVAGLYLMGPGMQGVPPNWLSYIAVEDADVAARKITANGGKLVKEPFDVMEVGRMAVATDPTGAVFAIWQAKQHHGFAVAKEAGAPTWHELSTSNVDKAGKFYIDTFGWTAKPFDMGPMGTYTLFSTASAADDAPGLGGMITMPPATRNVPSHWLAYFQVDDIDAETKKAVDLGGTVVVPPREIPNIGKMSIVRDPQGATFALYEHMH